jgi:hypothetical protein
MPPPAVHKSKDKKRRGAESSGREYSRRLQSLDGDTDIPIGRITKMLRFDRFMVTFWHEKKRQLMEVQAAVVDKNVERMKPKVGGLAAIVESGKEYEIYLPLTDTDAAIRSSRIHKSIQHTTSVAGGIDDDAGIEFDYGEEGTPIVEGAPAAGVPAATDKKDKKDKHVERVLREENDGSGGEHDVNVDDI